MSHHLYVGPPGFLGTLEIDCLRETMNMALGTAAAGLEEEVGLNVQLDVPGVDVVPTDEIVGYFVLTAGLEESSWVVEQRFWGPLSGNCYLMLPGGSGTSLLSVFSEGRPSVGDGMNDVLERAAILEIGNVLAGACVGQLCELLSTVVSYDPPVFHRGCDLRFAESAAGPDGQTAVSVRSHFRFEIEGVEGSVVVVISEASVARLRTALGAFVEQLT